jgi:hypothetical protein
VVGHRPIRHVPPEDLAETILIGTRHVGFGPFVFEFGALVLCAPDHVLNVVGAARDPHHRVVLRRGNHISLAADQGGVEANQSSRHVIGHDSAPQLGTETGDELDAAHRRPGLAKRRDRRDQLCCRLAGRRVELEICA